MKKRFVCLKSLVRGGVLFSLLLILSCGNFFNGADLRKEIEEQVAYANAKECTINVKSDAAYGSFLSEGEKKCKVGFSMDLQFAANAKNYSFEGLEAVSTGGESREDCVSFEICESDEKNNTYTISVTLLKAANDIIIRPKCAALPKIVEIKPALSAGGVEQDSIIEVSFNKAMDAESFGDFSCLTISSDGEDLADLFDTPHFYDGNTKIGIVPLCATNNTKLLLEPSKNISYRNITVSFRFTGKEKDSYGLSLEENTQYTYKINRELSNSLPSIYVDISGSKGKLSPSKGSYKCIKTYIYPLSFDPDLSYEFIRWKILDPETGLELQNGNQVTLEDPYEQSTNYSLASDVDGERKDVVLFPEVAERPQVISYAPMTLGQLKDSTIQVLFDRDMDENSIYYTEDEIDELKKSGISNSNFLPPLGSSTKHYGYVSGGKTYFKNIVLTNNKTGKNINDRFAAPFFDDPRTLSIPASKESGHILDDFTQVLVSIEKEFFYSEQLTDTTFRPVTLSQSKKWMYQVNNRTDDKPLVIAKSGSTELFSAKFKSDNTKFQKSAPFTLGKSGFEGMKFIKNGNFKFDLDIEVLEQEGSGPNSYFTVTVKKIYGANYATSSYKKSFTPYYQTVTSDTAVFSGIVDLEQEGVTLGDGVYEVVFDFMDRSGNHLIYPSGSHFYFAVDTKAPEISTPTISSTNSTTYTLNWSDYVDLKTAEIIVTGSTTSSETITNGALSKNITNIQPDKTYNMKVKFTDYAGNSVEKTVPKFLTGYTFTGSPNFMGTNASHAQNIFFVGDKISDYGITAKKYYSDGTSTTVGLTSNDTIPTRSAYDSSWTYTYTYSEDNISKNADLSGYYIAKKDSLTQKPVYDKNYHERDDNTNNDKHYKFGDFPQTVSKISNYTSSTVYNGWYLGRDGYFYEKQTANNSADRKKFSNGNTISNGTNYYFKVEPIYWRALTTNYDHDQKSSTAGKTLLFADKVLKGDMPFYLSQSTRTIGVSTVYGNSWRYSTMRAYLNGSYESGDTQTKTYSGKGFLQKAFTSSAQNLIATTSVDNSKRSTNPYNDATLWNSGNNPYAENNPTSDKIFLLSIYDLTNTSSKTGDYYHFNGTCSAGGAGSNRGRDPSDYALSVSAYVSSDDGCGAYYWQRSSTYHSPGINVRFCDTAGNAANSKTVELKMGVVPALVLVNAP